MKIRDPVNIKIIPNFITFRLETLIMSGGITDVNIFFTCLINLSSCLSVVVAALIKIHRNPSNIPITTISSLKPFQVLQMLDR